MMIIMNHMLKMKNLRLKTKNLGLKTKNLGLRRKNLGMMRSLVTMERMKMGVKQGPAQQQDAEPANSTQGMSGRKTKRRRRLPKDKVHTYVSEQIIHAHLHVSILHYILSISVCSELLILKYNKLVYQTM